MPDIPGIDKIMSALLTRAGGGERERGGVCEGVMCAGMRDYVRTRPHAHANDRMPDTRIYPRGVGKYRSLKSESVANIPIVQCTAT